MGEDIRNPRDAQARRAVDSRQKLEGDDGLDSAFRCSHPNLNLDTSRPRRFRRLRHLNHILFVPWSSSPTSLPCLWTSSPRSDVSPSVYGARLVVRPAPRGIPRRGLCWTRYPQMDRSEPSLRCGQVGRSRTVSRTALGRRKGGKGTKLNTPSFPPSSLPDSSPTARTTDPLRTSVTSRVDPSMESSSGPLRSSSSGHHHRPRFVHLLPFLRLLRAHPSSLAFSSVSAVSSIVISIHLSPTTILPLFRNPSAAHSNRLLALVRLPTTP